MIINPVQRKVGLMKNKTKKISKASILFYVLAVLFLLATLLFAKLTHDYISASAENSGTITLETTISIYLSNCGSYLAYSFIFYSIGMILSKFSFMTHTLADCMVEEVEEKESENETDTEDDYFSIDAKDKTEEPAETKD